VEISVKQKSAVVTKVLGFKWLPFFSGKTVRKPRIAFANPRNTLIILSRGTQNQDKAASQLQVCFKKNHHF